MNEEKAVVVCTELRGVFFGYTKDVDSVRIKLRAARNAYYWKVPAGTGVHALASVGPLQGSKIGARADVQLRKVTAVFDCTPEAVQAWEAATWA